MSIADTFGKRRRNGPVNIPDLPRIGPTPQFIIEMAQQNATAVPAQDGDAASPDAQAARERHFAAALMIESDATALSENAQKLLAIITQALDLAKRERDHALEQAAADCRATEESLIRAAHDHIAATEIYQNLAKNHADVVRADGDKLLGVIREADDRLNAKTQAILQAQKPAAEATEEKPAAVPPPPTFNPAPDKDDYAQLSG
jgi:hypothetical protein